jgi:hypothetical protein
MKTWYRNPPGTQWKFSPNTSDTLAVECSDPATARALAESASFK